MLDIQRAVDAAERPIKGVIHLQPISGTVQQARNGQCPVGSSVSQMLVFNTDYANWMVAIESEPSGAWDLHHALAEQPLDFFLVASCKYMIGNQMGELNDASEDASLDALCQYRHNLTSPALVLKIYIEDSSDRISSDLQVASQAKGHGLSSRNVQKFLDFVELTILDSDYTTWNTRPKPVSPCRTPGWIVEGLRPRKYSEGVKDREPWHRDPQTAIYYNTKDFSGMGQSIDSSTLEDLVIKARANPSVLSDSANIELLAYEIGKKAMEVRLRTDEEIDISLSLLQLAMDSLKAVEMQQWWRQTFGIEISTFELMMPPRSLKELAKATAEKIIASWEVTAG